MIRVRMSTLTDEFRAGTDGVMRGAEYVYEDDPDDDEDEETV